MITRFAPSPTGPLHLGHAYSALTIWNLAGAHPVLLRIEDVDSARSRPEHVDGILRDLTWLGLSWTGPVLKQSNNRAAYDQTLASLAARDLIYPCRCTRRDITEAGAKSGPDGMIYPGTCRRRAMADARPDDAIRLDLSRVAKQVPPMVFLENGPLHAGRHHIDIGTVTKTQGDPVLRRRDNQDYAYLLACTHDDAAQGVTHVIRGDDLWGQTPLQVILQTLMGWQVPTYHHHDLIRDETGKRLAKINKSKALATLRAEGATPQDIRQMVGF